MREILIKVLVDGQQVTTTPQDQGAFINDQQHQAVQEALDELRTILEGHKWLTKPVMPVQLMALKRKLERLL